MSDPAYKPPLRFRLGLRLQNGGRICGTLRYYSYSMQIHVLYSRAGHKSIICFNQHHTGHAGGPGMATQNLLISKYDTQCKAIGLVNSLLESLICFLHAVLIVL